MDVASSIHQALASLEPEYLQLDDDSAHHAGHPGAKSGGGHYRLDIVSKRFAGLSRVQRHRLIYEALSGLMSRNIHALAITARTPDEL